jgi:hypothetical protein
MRTAQLYAILRKYALRRDDCDFVVFCFAEAENVELPQAR